VHLNDSFACSVEIWFFACLGQKKKRHFQVNEQSEHRKKCSIQKQRPAKNARNVTRWLMRKTPPAPFIPPLFYWFKSIFAQIGRQSLNEEDTRILKIKFNLPCVSYLSEYFMSIVSQYFLQSVDITTEVVSSNPVHGGYAWYNIYVIKFVSHLRQVSDYLQALWFPPPIKLTATM
jgi:hypothetical protein